MTRPHPGLEFIGVEHRYGSASSISDITFQVTAGDVVCLLGPSGCGKTTVLRLAAGLEMLEKGRIIINGTVMADAQTATQSPPEHRNTGLVFQDFALFPHLSIMDNILFGLRKPDHRHIGMIKRRMALMGVDTLASKYPHMLSGGQQQRVALLRALAPGPQIMLLDEPFSGLDADLRAQIREDTLRVLKDSGVATLMVTHDPEEAMYMADDMLVMHEGTIVQDGSPTQIYHRPVNDYVATLFGPVNRLQGRIKGRHLCTALGDFPLNGATPAGTSGRLLIRQEGITLLAAGPDHLPTGHILSVRPLGRDNQVRVAADDGTGHCFEVRALIRGMFTMREGSKVSLKIDPDHSFVFAD